MCLGHDAFKIDPDPQTFRRATLVRDASRQHHATVSPLATKERRLQSLY